MQRETESEERCIEGCGAGVIGTGATAADALERWSSGLG